VTVKQLQRLGDLLLSANLIDEIQLRVALQEQSESGERLGSALVHLGFIDESVLAAFLSKQTDLPCVNINGLLVPSEILSLVDKETALERSILPVRRSGDVLYLAMADPFDERTIEVVSEKTGLDIIPMIAPEFRLRRSLKRYYEPDQVRVDQSVPELREVVEEMNQDDMSRLVQKVEELSAKVDFLTAMVEEISETLSGS